MNLAWVGLFTVYATLILSVIACSDGQAGFLSNKVLSGNENALTRQVGSEVGDIAPEFNIPLINGGAVSNSHSHSDSTPVFLFFFSPF